MSRFGMPWGEFLLTGGLILAICVGGAPALVRFFHG